MLPRTCDSTADAGRRVLIALADPAASRRMIGRPITDLNEVGGALDAADLERALAVPLFAGMAEGEDSNYRLKLLQTWDGSAVFRPIHHLNVS